MTARLDYSKPPPGYRIDEQDGEWDWSVGGDVPRDGNASLITTEADALAAAWTHYKAERDPPGMEVACYGGSVFWFHVNGTPQGEPFRPADMRDEASLSKALSVAQLACRAAAWAWHDRRHALAKQLDEDVICPECRSRDAHVEAIDDETTTQPWCVECDLEMGGMTLAGWPECLRWTDEQADEVERWLRDGRAAFPGVLDDDPCDDG